MRARLTTSLFLFLTVLTLKSSSASAQTTAKSVCTDGTTSTVTGRGACSSHGGVDAKATAKLEKAIVKADKKEEKAVDKAEVKADKSVAKAEAKGNKDATDATAQCKDGTYSHAKTHRGACSGHGGVSTFLKP